MADIELVIKIPEGLKKDFELEQWTALSCMELKNALENATLIPKGHGRLIDEKELIDEIVCENIDGNYFDIIYAHSIYDASTIIEADKTESEPQESDIEKRKPCINHEDGCEEWAGCPCVCYKAESEDSEEIKVGDKVKYRPSFTKEDTFGVVTGIDNDHHYAYIMDADGNFCTVIFADLIKTGESYPEIPEVLKHMRGNIKADSAPRKYNYLRNIGYSSHDDESWYECPVCKRQYRSWALFREGINSGDVFQCECGEKLLYK